MGQVVYWIVLVALLFAAWYFLLIRPQRKRVKEHEALMEQLKPGDHAITVAGMYGEVDRISEHTVVLKLEDGARMKVSKASIERLEEID